MNCLSEACFAWTLFSLHLHSQSNPLSPSLRLLLSLPDPPQQGKALFTPNITLYLSVDFAASVFRCCYFGFRQGFTGCTLVYCWPQLAMSPRWGPKPGTDPPASASQGAGITGMRYHSPALYLVFIILMSELYDKIRGLTSKHTKETIFQ